MPVDESHADDCLLVFITCPEAEAQALAQILVEQRLAACVSRQPDWVSVYRWEDAIESATETLLVAKTTAARYAELERVVRQHHPYELPEVVAVRLDAGLPDYFNWLKIATR